MLEEQIVVRSRECLVQEQVQGSQDSHSSFPEIFTSSPIYDEYEDDLEPLCFRVKNSSNFARPELSTDYEHVKVNTDSGL